MVSLSYLAYCSVPRCNRAQLARQEGNGQDTIVVAAAIIEAPRTGGHREAVHVLIKAVSPRDVPLAESNTPGALLR